jgi:hypothetical protein
MNNLPMRRFIPAVALVAAFAISAGFVPSPSPAAQLERYQEVAATLATGRVVFCVTKDSVLVGALEGGGEPGSRPPAVVPVNGGTIGVILGAVEWSSPGAGQNAFRLDAELPHAASSAPPANPVTSAADLSQPMQIENIGIGVLELLRPQVEQIHHKLDLAPDEPILEILLADYVQDYGPEIWSLQYRVRQQTLGNDYWETRPLRPAYNQIYPPEKGQPRTFIEVRYPDKQTQPSLLDQLRQHDPQLAPIANASPELTQAMASILKGESQKAVTEPVVNFLRAALPALGGANAKVALAKLDEDRGFQWVMAPVEPVPPSKQTTPQDPTAPSLRKYTQPN